MVSGIPAPGTGIFEKKQRVAENMIQTQIKGFWSKEQ